MALRIAINGFGRIGRMTLRAIIEQGLLGSEIDVVAVNDVVPADNLAYLLKYDTTQGNMPQEVYSEKSDASVAEDDTIVIDDYKIKALALKVAPSELPWRELNVDIVIESTGLFTKTTDAQGHVTAGAKRVIISAPGKDDDSPTLIQGVNETDYEPERHLSVSNASCTTNCLVPLVQVLMQEGIGIEEGLMTTLHSYTASQVLMDGPSRKDFRGGRAAALNIIPSTTGAATATAKAIPAMKGKLTGLAFRVPTAAVSCVDLTFRSVRSTSYEEICALMKKASETYLNGILGYTEEELVSSDFIHNPLSSIFDAKAGIGLNDRFFKLIAWYDNEWGYANRLVDVARHMDRTDKELGNLELVA